jgi:hypothetical protein
MHAFVGGKMSGADLIKESLIGRYPILKYFNFSHLPAPLKAVSQEFHDLAWVVADQGVSVPETAAALRKLLEAKDCAVRSVLP